MILRIHCPKCHTRFRLREPLPPKGERFACAHCGTIVSISYSDQVLAKLQERGVAFLKPGELVPPKPEASAPQAPAAAPPRPDPPSKPAPPPAPEPPPASKRPPADPALTPPPAVPPLFSEPPRTGPRKDWSEDLDTLRGDATEPPARPGPPVPEAPLPPARTAPSPAPELPPAPPADDSLDDSDDSLDDSLDDNLDDVPAAAPPPAAAAAAPSPRAERRPRRARKEPKRRQKAGTRQPRSRGRRWLKVLGTLVVLAAVLGVSTVAGVVWYFSQDLPSVRSLETYEPPVGTLIKDPTGRVVGEIFEEQRYVVPFEQIPEDLRNAFVSAEDASFWQHSGIDFMGIARAMIVNIREGRMAQGASTITQQVARTFLLSREKKLKRKIKEAILAHRIENNFSKDYILYLYLNQVFLGHGAYGVQSAAHLYFDKDVSELSLAECAIIAGLPQAPSSYSPNRHFEAARKRQRYVLNQMAAKGYITQGEADAAYDGPLAFARKRDRNLDIAPFYAEHVRRMLLDKFDHETVYRSGLQVTIPIDWELQAQANKAVREGVRKADKRIGFRADDLVKLEGEDAIAAKLAEIDHQRVHDLLPYDPGRKLPAGPVDLNTLPELTSREISEGVVTEVTKKYALVDVGSRRGLMTIDDFTWCHKPEPDLNWRWFKCRQLDDILFPGDVIEVQVHPTSAERAVAEAEDKLESALRVARRANRAADEARAEGTSDEARERAAIKAGKAAAKARERLLAAKEAQAQQGDPREDFKHTLGNKWQGETRYRRLKMDQSPAPESSLLSLRVADGGVLAMVGGSDYTKSEFNRPLQAKRQVGSTFKPLVYSAALDFEDAVITPSTIFMDAPIVEQMPGETKDEIKLWKPANSGNKFGGDTPLRRGLVLSNNTVTLKILQRIGLKYTLEYMTRFGFDTPLDPNWAMGLGATAMTMYEMLRAYTVFPTLGDRREPYFISEIRDRNGKLLEETREGELTEDVMDERTAYQMVRLMQDVVRGGTATKALSLGVPVAGKTGTTNAFRDAWFVGYTPELLTSVWVGLDEFKSMGKGQYGGDVALPIWIDYMRVALDKYPPSEFERPKGVVIADIDSKSGKLAREGEPSVRVAFKKDTEPTEYAPVAGQMNAADFLSGEF